MDTLKVFGSNLKRYRVFKGLSQEELAELVNLHRTYIGAVERGERNISLLNIKKLADALGVSIKDLMPDSNNIKNS